MLFLALCLGRIYSRISVKFTGIFADIPNLDLIIHTLCTIMMNDFQFCRPCNLFPLTKQPYSSFPYGEYNPALQSKIGFKS